MARRHNLGTTVCHQRLIREKHLADDLARLGENIRQIPLNEYILCYSERMQPEYREFIERYEWLGNVGNNPKWIFEARCHGELAGVVMLNEPNAYSSHLLRDINSRTMECLIQRGACASWAHQHLGSKIIRFACREMTKLTTRRVFVAYSDPRAGEIGTIYQACGFDYLGNSFGASRAYVHPSYKSGRPFSSQSLGRTSELKKFCKKHGILWSDEWEKPNGFKDLTKIPKDIILQWRLQAKRILAESKTQKVPPKGKYILVLGKDRREQKALDKLKAYVVLPYPKRRATT